MNVPRAFISAKVKKWLYYFQKDGPSPILTRSNWSKSSHLRSIKKSFVVVVKIDDDSEVVIKSCDSFEEAQELADLCTGRINGGDEDGSGAAADDDFEDDDSW